MYTLVFYVFEALFNQVIGLVVMFTFPVVLYAYSFEATFVD